MIEQEVTNMLKAKNIQDSTEIRDAAMKQLDYLGQKYKEQNDEWNSLKRFVDDAKAQIKKIMTDYNISQYTCSNGVILSHYIKDNSTLDEELVLKYLKEHGLEKFIHTKEYFDETELAMAIANGQINGADLAPFKIEKYSTFLRTK